LQSKAATAVRKEVDMPLDLCRAGSRDLLERTICLSALSKNLKGELRPLHHALERCAKLRCRTLKTIHFVHLKVTTNRPCDSRTGQLLDGDLTIRNLVTAFEGGDGTKRGVHEGDFIWQGRSLIAIGSLSGITNAGTHRKPPFDACQTCDAEGFMEGRFCGTIRRSERPQLVGCQVIGTYRFRFKPTRAEGGQGGISGTMEGEIVCACPE
jgi:hypothetical protein